MSSEKLPQSSSDEDKEKDTEEEESDDGSVFRIVFDCGGFHGFSFLVRHAWIRRAGSSFQCPCGRKLQNVARVWRKKKQMLKKQLKLNVAQRSIEMKRKLGRPCKTLAWSHFQESSESRAKRRTMFVLFHLLSAHYLVFTPTLVLQLLQMLINSLLWCFSFRLTPVFLMFSVISISFLLACLSHVATWSSSFTNFGCNSRKLSVRIGELRTQLGSTIEETCLSGRSISGFITLRNGFKNWTRTQNKHDLASLHVWWNEVRTWTWPSLPSLSVLLQGYTYKMSFFGTSLHIRSVTFLQFPLSFPAWFSYCAIVSCFLFSHVCSYFSSFFPNPPPFLLILSLQFFSLFFFPLVIFPLEIEFLFLIALVCVSFSGLILRQEETEEEDKEKIGEGQRRRKRREQKQRGREKAKRKRDEGREGEERQ